MPHSYKTSVDLPGEAPELMVPYTRFKLEHGWQDRALTDLELSCKTPDDNNHFETIPVTVAGFRKRSIEGQRRPAQPSVPKRRNSHKRGLTQADVIDRRTFVAVTHNRPKLKRWHSMHSLSEAKQKQARPKGRPRKDDEARKRQPVEGGEKVDTKRSRMAEDRSPSATTSPAGLELPRSVPTNSLDFLSYAIAMTEKRDAAERLTQSQPLPSLASQYSDEDMEDAPQLDNHTITASQPLSSEYDQRKVSSTSLTDEYDDEEDEDEDEDDDDELDCPSSPRAEAAEAIMMFVRGGPHR
ncbi:hypothetical protein NQZ79_g5610 [Umbelopsis isabellina]|nr:hypothetical protein NQZ79_g5610 [Umbelopsis isabellina]